MNSRLRLLLVVVPAILGVLAAVVLRFAYPDVLVRFTVTPAGLALEAGALFTLIVGVGVIVADRSAKRRQELAAAGALQASIQHQEFLARLDHEMKNPLTAIRAALAAHGTSGSPHLEIADAQTERLGSLVGDLRKLSDLQSRPLEVEPVDLGEIVGEAVQAVNASLQQAGSSREFMVSFPTVPWRIPAVGGDSDLLYLVVFNLLANAAKFTGDGDRVEVRAGMLADREIVPIPGDAALVIARDLLAAERGGLAERLGQDEERRVLGEHLRQVGGADRAVGVGLRELGERGERHGFLSCRLFRVRHCLKKRAYATKLAALRQVGRGDMRSA